MKFAFLLGAAGAALLTAPAYAQTPAQTPAPQDTAAAPADEFIVVTGSRIARGNLDSAIPISTLTATELRQTGSISIGDTLSVQPGFRPTTNIQNSGTGIGVAGLTLLDLRGQGTARTLVLVNGRRHVSSQTGASSVDTNTIPNDLVERVDVVTGGNSAIYGSDAVAGVVNFVMKRDFEGLMANGQMGVSSRGDRPTYYGSVTAGKNFNEGRGNIAVNFEYANSDPLFNVQRDEITGAFSGRSQFNATESTIPGGVAELPAGNGIPDTTFLTGVRNNNISNGGLYTSACPVAAPGNEGRRALNCTGLRNPTGASELGRTFVFLPDGTLVANPITTDLRPFSGANAVGGLGATLRDTGVLQVGSERIAGNLLFSYEVSEGFRPFLEAKVVRTKNTQEGQPTFFSGTLPTTFRLDNPFISAQARNVLTQSLAPGATTFSMLRYNVDFGGRGEDHERTLYRVVAGFDGNFLDTWRYEVAFNYGRVDTFYKTRGNVLVANATRAVDSALAPDGTIQCRVNVDANLTNDDPACRPLNIFGEGRASQAALDYILVDSTRDEWTEQLNALAYVSGDSAKLFELPGGPVGFVLGGEWRQERSFGTYDDVTKSGQTFLNAFSDFDPPKLEIWEGFAEVRVPILKDVPFFQELTVEGATRVSNYNVGNTGTVWAFNAGVIWQPIEDLRLRGSWARAVRAPTMQNLFNAGNQTFLNGLLDPCSQTRINSNPNRTANCAAAGVPTTQTYLGITEPFTNVPASGILGLSGGNPGLEEEQSTNWTFGGVLRPSFLPGLSLAVDYYDIDIDNVIVTLAAQTIINQCYDSPDGITNQFCSAIFRRPDGTFAGQSNITHAGQTVTLNAPLTNSFIQGGFNYARQRTKGIDFDLSYSAGSSEGWRFNGRAVVAYVIARDQFTSITEPDRRTRILSTQGDPQWAATLRLNLGFKDWDANWNLRYVGEQTVATTWRTQFSEQNRPPENADAFPRKFYPDVTYHDIRIQKQLGEHRVYFGIDNLFDTLPPLGLTGTADDALFDNTGRFFYVGVSLKY